MTIEPSGNVDRLKTWGCGILIAAFVIAAGVLAFVRRGEGDAGDLTRRVETLEKRVEALERK